MAMSGEAELLTTVVSALKRIARKPWPSEHKFRREFVKQGGGTEPVEVVATDLIKTDPLWKPAWAKAEKDACECFKCIAIRVLDDISLSQSVENSKPISVVKPLEEQVTAYLAGTSGTITFSTLLTALKGYSFVQLWDAIANLQEAGAASYCGKCRCIISRRTAHIETCPVKDEHKETDK